MSALNKRQIEQAWVNAGGDEKYARLMANIAIRESGGRPRINNAGTNKNGTTDWGLFQINDIWRKDPVVGPLFRSGAILTPEGNAKAAVHILKVQGPRAWATYNPATDSQYLGGFHGAKGGSAGGSSLIPGLRRTPQQLVLGNQTTFDQAGFEKAKRAALVGSMIARDRGTNNILFRSGLLSTSAPNPQDFTSTSLTSKITGGQLIPAAARPTAQKTAQGVRVSGPLFELFWQGNRGIDVKNGKVVPQGFVSGHTDHVHVAAPPHQVVRLGKIAQRMGLNVGENPRFGGVHPVHVKNSYHYRNEAIDVSGPTNLMTLFAHRVAHMYGVGG